MSESQVHPWARLMVLALSALLQACSSGEETRSEAAFQADSAKDVLMIVKDIPNDRGDAPTIAEARMMERLRGLGYTVTLATEQATHPLNLSTFEAVLITGSTSLGSVAASYKTAQKPVIVAEPSLLDDLGMTGAIEGSDHGSAPDQTQVTIANRNTSIAQRLGGTQLLQPQPTSFGWGRPGNEASIVATLANDSSKASLFTYDKGNRLADGTTAAGKRAFLWADGEAFDSTTATGLALFERTFDWALRASGIAVAQTPSSAITVDADLESAWEGALIHESSKVVAGTVDSQADLWGNYGVAWDKDHVYLVVEVMDDVLMNDSVNVYDDDGIDIYFDMNDNGGVSFGADDFMFQLGYGDSTVIETKHNATSGVSFSTRPIAGATAWRRSSHGPRSESLPSRE